MRADLGKLGEHGSSDLGRRICAYTSLNICEVRGEAMTWGEQRLYLVVHHLFLGVVLSEHGEEFNDA